MKRHIILVGLSGAGKTTVGRLVAAALGGNFCDLDACTEAMTGMSVARLFETRGEAAFRGAEREALAQVLAGGAQVVAAGAGWVAQPGELERVVGRALVVHLACAPETAARRLAGTGDRPLLAGDLLGTLRRLATERAAFYARADATVETDSRTVNAVTDAVVLLARSVGGW